jgi:hypothetical protein
MCATWGGLGGLTTFYRYGPGYYRLLALRRWGKISDDALAEYVATAKATKKTEAG